MKKPLTRILNIAVNLLVLSFFLVAAFGPNGYVRGIIVERRATRAQLKAIDEAWPTIVFSEQTALPTIVEFTDYQCSYCRRMQTVLAEGERRKLFTVIHLNFPITNIHPAAEPAARAALCAAEQGRFNEMHEHLLLTSAWQSSPNPWTTAAMTVKVPDVASFASCMQSRRIGDRLRFERNIAQQIGVRSTPTYISKSGIHRGSATIGQLLDLIDR